MTRNPIRSKGNQIDKKPLQMENQCNQCNGCAAVLSATAALHRDHRKLSHSRGRF
jgi:hypothetical protein